MASKDFKFSGAYGGNGKKKEKKKYDFDKADKESAERNKNLSKWEQDTIKASRKRTREKYLKAKAKMNKKQ